MCMLYPPCDNPLSRGSRYLPYNPVRPLTPHLISQRHMQAISTWDHPSDVPEVKHFFLAIYNVSVVGGAMYFFSLYGAQVSTG